MNAVNFTGFGKVDSNLFFALCTKMKSKGTQKANFSFSEIRNLAGYTNTTVSDFVRDLESSYDKLLNLKIRVGDDEEFIKFNLFNYFEVSTSAQQVYIACNEHFEEILNDWTGEWTAFKLEEYVNLKSVYSKHMYRLLKQWRTVGGHAWKISELRELIEIPESYDMRKITQKVLTPIEKELSAYFTELTIEKIKTGRRITAIKFSFQREDNDYIEIEKREDLRSKQEKIDDLNNKIKNGREDLSELCNQIKTEKRHMEKKGIPDRSKKSLFSRFFNYKR